MKTIEELQSYFENEIKPGLSDLEKWRKRALIRAVIVDAVFISLTAYLVYLLVNYSIKSINVPVISDGLTLTLIPGFVFFCSFIVVLFYMFYIMYRGVWYRIKYSSYLPEKHVEFKKAVIMKIVNFLSPELKYTPERKMVTGKDFLEGEIFPHRTYYPTGYMAEDFVEGKIGEINISFYEINGKEMVYPQGIVDRKSNWGIFNEGKFYDDGTVEGINFSGLFFTLDFNKSFNGHTLVLPESKIKNPQWTQKSGREPVHMDDPEFESLFKVYGTDQITARYILSTSLMRRITDYRKKAGRKIYLSFLNNKLYLAISHRKDLFEMNLYKSLYDFEQAKEFYHDMKIAVDIVEDLNLNTQIWLKNNKKNEDLHQAPADYKYRKRWLFILLSYTFGYLGLHYFYIGYTGKGIRTLLITLVIFPFLIYQSFIRHNDLYIMILIFLTPIIYPAIVKYAHHLNRDSKGFPMH